VRQVAVRQPTARPVVPMAGAAACYRVGTLRQGRRRLTRRLARSLLMCLLAAASEVPPNERAMGIARRNPDLRSRARRGTRTPPLTRRPPQCRPAPPAQAGAGDGQTTAGRSPTATGRSPTATGRSPMATGRSPVTVRPRRSRARHGRRQDQLQPGAAPDMRQDPVHRGHPHRGPMAVGLRRPGRLSGLPAVVGRNLPAVPLPPRLSAQPRRRQPRSRPRPSGRRRPGRRQPSLRRRASAGGTTGRLQAARPPAAGAAIPF
jgi:hypothetical protein